MNYSEKVDANIVPEKEFKIELSMEECMIFTELAGCANVSISVLFQKIIEDIVHAYNYIRNNNYLKGKHIAKITYTQNSFFNLKEQLSVQKVIADIAYTFNNMDDNYYSKIFSLNLTQKTFLRYLCERDILEMSVGNWEMLVNLKQELKENCMRNITLRCGKRSRKCKRGYLKCKIEEYKEDIELRKKHLKKIYKGYVQWSGKAGSLVEEIEHVISWIGEIQAFKKHISWKS